ncbi:MAG: exonuclease SbcCD subunit D [Evtepia sp.]
MKFIHLSDLHIGKVVNEFSMLDDQRFILDQILALIDIEKPDAVIIAGDIYDKSIPTAEAVHLFDDFLVRLSTSKVFVISGNHDSPERIAFGARLIKQSGVFLSPVYDGTVTPISLTDQYGILDVFLLPFIKPAHVRAIFSNAEISSYTDALQTAIHAMPIDPTHRNLLVTHQFVRGALRSDSEEISVGGSNAVDSAVFAPFDYVALGHIHAPQTLGRDTIRYCGSPLKYSFSESEKSLSIIEFAEKGNISLRTIPLYPKTDLRKIKGLYLDLTAKRFYENTNTNDYLSITLTDEYDIPDAISKLRVIYPNIMKLDYDNKRTHSQNPIFSASELTHKSPLQLFAAFYKEQNNQELSDVQSAFLMDLIEKLWEDHL